jgi:alpha-1,6-mannosyltransferase
VTFVIAIAGPSVMEPALPGRPGQPPWAASLHLGPYAAVALTVTALLAGAAGLGCCLYAARRGWAVSPGLLLGAGLLVATAIAMAPPFGSSDHLSYAAYGRMVATGHDPYTTTPAVLARLGDPVARAVQDWRGSPSVYGSLATGGQALASVVGGTSVRLTVFVLSLLNLAAFAGTGLLLHRLGRGDRGRQVRAGLLWTFNPLLLQALVAGGHVDALALVFAVAAVTLFSSISPNASPPPPPRRTLGLATLAGVMTGLAFSVKLSMALIVVGLVLAAWLVWWPHRLMPGGGSGEPGRRRVVVTVGGLIAGFALTAAAGFVPWGTQSLGPALRAGSYVSIGSPWRPVRSALRLAIGEQNADNLVKAGAVVLAVGLLVLLARPLMALAGRLMGLPDAAPGVLVPASVLVVALAWLFAWPYVLPWYDSLAWALLAMLPWLPVPWAALDWLVLVRGAALAVGYLPARGIAMPEGLTWLRTVVRTGVTPFVLAVVVAGLMVLLWPHERHDAPA